MIKPYILYCISLTSTLLFCSFQTSHTDKQSATTDLEIHSSSDELVAAFNWAKDKARFYVQTGKKGKIDVWERGEGSGNVNYLPCYWAGYPGRSAFYSRDFCHQLTGAHLLGLHEENFTMMKAFAASADEGKLWFPLWAINFDGSPFLLDYKGDDNFVREVPATFELLEKAYELYLWTGDERYFKDDVLWNYYSKTVTDFIALHDAQIPNGIAEGTGKGIFQGAASYNEQHDHPLIESGDGVACQFKAFEAFAQMAALRGEQDLAKAYTKKTAELKTYFNEDWGIKNTQTYNRGYTSNREAIAGWGKENSWFIPMKGIAEAGSERTQAYLDFINERLESKDDIPDNIEALSYIPETFFLHHRNELGWKWMKHIMNNLKQDHSYKTATGRNGDYPEVSYVLIQNVIKDLLGVLPNALENSISTLSHLPEEIEYLGVKHINMGTSFISVTHETGLTSSLYYQHGMGKLFWKAGFVGEHNYVYVNGIKKPCIRGMDNGMQYSYCMIEMSKGDEVIVSINP